MRIIMHAHHAYSLFSCLSSLKNRIAEIKVRKPLEEQALRSALIQDVTDDLPKNDARDGWEKAGKDRKEAEEAFEKAYALYYEASLTRNGAWKAYEELQTNHDRTYIRYVRADAVYERAEKSYLDSFDVEEFHRSHCHPNCPWDGTTIFAKGTGVEVLSAG